MIEGYEFIGVILDVIGASLRFIFCKLFGSNKGFKYYLDNKVWLNRWLGFLIVGIIIFIVVNISNEGRNKS